MLAMYCKAVTRQGALGRGGKKKHLSRGKETLVAQLWHRCSKMLYRLLTHTNSHLHKASCSASVDFRDATVNCLSSVFNQSFCPSCPLLISASSCSVPFPLRPPTCHLSSYPSLQLSHNYYHSLGILPSLSLSH